MYPIVGEWGALEYPYCFYAQLIYNGLPIVTDESNPLYGTLSNSIQNVRIRFKLKDRISSEFQNNHRGIWSRHYCAVIASILLRIALCCIQRFYTLTWSIIQISNKWQISCSESASVCVIVLVSSCAHISSYSLKDEKSTRLSEDLANLIALFRRLWRTGIEEIRRLIKTRARYRDRIKNSFCPELSSGRCLKS